MVRWTPLHQFAVPGSTTRAEIREVSALFTSGDFQGRISRTSEVSSVRMKFEWDAAKDQSNQDKHGIFVRGSSHGLWRSTRPELGRVRAFGGGGHMSWRSLRTLQSICSRDFETRWKS